MRIERSRPPNYDEIVRTFPAVAGKPVLFAYGDTIFNPMGVHVTAALQAHEEVHGDQQGATPDYWWNFYLRNPVFRLGEELKAHVHEFDVLRNGGNRAERRRALKLVATKLASPIYGPMVTVADARRLLQQEIQHAE